MTSATPEHEAVRRWIASLPSAEESARAEVAPFLDMTPEERLQIWAKLQRSMDEFVRLHPPVDDPADREFWRHWRDPMHGRPR